MRVSVETTTGLERKATIVLPADTFEAKVADRLKQRAATLKLPGFRPGRVPLKEVRRRFDGAARAEAAQTLIRESLPTALAEQDFLVVGVPQVELLNTDAGNDFEYAATFEVMPTFELQPFETLRVRRPAVEVTGADVDATVELLREKQAEWVEVQRAAEPKDRVTVDYVVKVNGEPRIQGTDQTIVAGARWLRVPQLPETVLGMAAGETRTFPTSVMMRARQDAPEQPPAEDGASAGGEPAGADPVAEAEPAEDGASAGGEPAGADPVAEAEPAEAGAPTAIAPQSDATDADTEATLGYVTKDGVGETTVKRVEEPHLPALDDSFFDGLGIEPGPDRSARFRTQVEGRMRAELETAVQRAIRGELAEVLGRTHSFDLPRVMVQTEVLHRAQGLAQNWSLDAVPEWFQQLVLAEAMATVRLSLVLGRVAEAAELALDQERVKARISEIATNFEDQAEAERAIYADQEQLERVASVVLQDQAIEHLLAHAEVVDVPCGYAEAIAGQALPPLPADDEDASPAGAENEPAAPEAIGGDAAAQAPPQEVATADSADAEAAPDAPGAAAADPASTPEATGLVGRLRRLVRRGG